MLLKTTWQHCLCLPSWNMFFPFHFIFLCFVDFFLFLWASISNACVRYEDGCTPSAFAAHSVMLFHVAGWMDLPLTLCSTIWLALTNGILTDIIQAKGAHWLIHWDLLSCTSIFKVAFPGYLTCPRKRMWSIEAGSSHNGCGHSSQVQTTSKAYRHMRNKCYFCMMPYFRLVYYAPKPNTGW